MKKFIKLFLSLSLFLTLAACTDTPDNGEDTKTDDTTLDVTDDTTADEDTTAENTPSKSGDTYEIVLSNGLTVCIGGNAEEFISKAGEPIDYMEAPSCVNEGYDKVYVFDGYSISTSPDADRNEYISELSLLSDTVLIGNGLSIGSGAAELDTLFGTNYTEEFGIRTYTISAVRVSAIVESDVVIGLTLTSTRY